jgi:hypothetical protein
MNMRYLLFFTLLLLLYSCTPEKTQKADVHQEHSKDTLRLITHADTLAHLDSLMRLANQSMASNKHHKDTFIVAFPQLGQVAKYAAPDSSYVFGIAGFEGEVGRTEIEWYQFRDSLMIASYRCIHFNFIQDVTNKELALEAVYYIVGQKVIQRTITFNKPKGVWHETDLPNSTKILVQLNQLLAVPVQ